MRTEQALPFRPNAECARNQMIPMSPAQCRFHESYYGHRVHAWHVDGDHMMDGCLAFRG